MSGRGRGRPSSRSAQEPAAGSSRRSTRHQQQHQNVAQPEVPQQHADSPEQQHQEQQQPQDGQQLAQGMNPQLEDPMSAALYHQVIDPAISGSQDAGMPPPPIPSAKNLRGQGGPPFSRRNTRGGSVPSSITAVPATDAFSSQPESSSQSTYRLQPPSQDEPS